jgi:signal transduction histidine kinase
MDHSLTIFQRGLLMVTVPLVAQAVFIGVMLRMQAERAAARRWTAHTKEVKAKVEEIYRIVLEGYAAAPNLSVLSDRSLADRFGDGVQQVPGLLRELRALVADNPGQQARIDALAVQSKRFLELLPSEHRELEAGEPSQSRDRLAAGAEILDEIRTSVDAILAEESRLDQTRVVREQRSSSRQTSVVLIGGVATLATTLVLAALFLHGVITRLTVLRDNTRRLAEGRALSTPLAGNDEIAEVDRAFHEMARGLDQQKQENEMFVYSVSHDLRSPLINLQGFSDELRLACRDIGALFQRDGVPPAVRQQGQRLLQENVEDSIRYIQTAVGRVERIIAALLRLSRAGRVEYQWQMVDVAATVEKVVDALRDTITDKQAEIDVHELPRSWGDPTAVEQIFANLIGNAAVYLDPARPGRIEIGSGGTSPSGQSGSVQTYYVKDNGLGIADSYHPRLFRAFNRLHASAAPGEGIGLALVHRMVERLGGKIWMESTVGVGTTFFVALAAAPPPGAAVQDGEQRISLYTRK